MEKEKFKKLLLNAAEETTRNILILNKSSRVILPLEDEYEYEATYKAHLYHSLLTKNVSFRNLRLEMRPVRKRLSGKHIDLWFEPINKEYSVLIEVKQVYHLNNQRNNIGDTDLHTTDSSGNLTGGIVADVIKLTEACKWKTNMYGIMLMTWSDSRTKDAFNLNSIRDRIIATGWDFDLRVNTGRIEMLWSSKNQTDYLTL